MRRYVLNALYCVCAVTFFSACGGGSSQGASAVNSDGLFGSVPGVLADNAQEQADFQEKVKKEDAKFSKKREMLDSEEKPKLDAAAMEKLVELLKEWEALDSECESKLETAAKKLVGKKVPYAESGELFYKITSEPVITVARANGSNAVSVDITYRAASKETMEIAKLAYGDYPICYKIVDAEGAPLWVSMGYVVSHNNEPVTFEAGQDYGRDLVMSLSILGEKNADDLQHAVKLVFIPEAEYDELKKQLK